MADPHQPEIPPMILRRLRSAVLSRPIQTHTHFHLSPRLHFSLSHTATQSATLRVETSGDNLAGERFIRREDLVHRIVTKGSRQEEAAARRRPDRRNRTRRRPRARHGARRPPTFRYPGRNGNRNGLGAAPTTPEFPPRPDDGVAARPRPPERTRNPNHRPPPASPLRERTGRL